MLHPSVRPCLGFAACSGTGKTTLLLELIPRLVAAGLRLNAERGFNPQKFERALRDAMARLQGANAHAHASAAA